jgi:hypothetical protein
MIDVYTWPDCWKENLAQLDCGKWQPLHPERDLESREAQREVELEEGLAKAEDVDGRMGELDLERSRCLVALTNLRTESSPSLCRTVQEFEGRR